MNSNLDPIDPGVGRRTDLTGQVAIVTGAGRGIGRAVAERLGRLGATVVVNYARSASGAEDAAAAIRAAGAEATTIRADVTRPAELRDLFASTRHRHGRVDIVVVNAGIDEVGSPFLEVTEDEYDRITAVNAKGAFFSLQQAARHVVDGGSIITIGSSTAIRPVAGFGLYGQSKVPPMYLVGVLAQELAPRGVTVNTVVPTAIDGAGYFAGADGADPVRAAAQGAGTIGGRMGAVSDVADAVEYLTGPLARWVSGQQLLITGGAPS